MIPIQAAATDSAYDFPLAHRGLEEQDIDFFVRPQALHDHTNVELKRDAFSYDVGQDAYLCPAGEQLQLNTLHRSASGLYWLYQADKQDCQNCPLREMCLSENDRREPESWSTATLRPKGSGIWPVDLTPITGML